MGRRTLGWPITLGVIMIVLVLALTVGWIVLFVRQAVVETRFSALYWTLLTVGTVFLVLVLIGVVLYLTISINAISLNQRQANFIDAVTHELKSPIASLKLYLQTLGRRQVDQKQQADFVRFMLEDVERLDQLIDHLLDAARLDEAVPDSEAADIALEPLLRHCAQMVALRYRAPQEAFEFRVPPVTVRGRLVDLELVFRNLLDNALKYGGTPPEVRIEVAVARPGQVSVRITDNGKGIPAVQRRRIFGRFVRLGQELERNKPGTGLGLYIVQTVVRRMKGRIAVHERHDAKGTIFEVQLPGAEVPAGTSEASAEAATP